MFLQKAFSDFILSRKLADLSDKTIQAYEMFVSPFIVYVGSGKLLLDVSLSTVSMVS